MAGRSRYLRTHRGGDVSDALTALSRLVRAGRVVVLTGAGISTDSGIPDYRGPSGTLRHRAPMTYREFVSDPAARRRYWAGSHLGWRLMTRARPNAAHHAVAALDHAGLLGGTITQNVDGLHQRAGSRAVLELHGSLATVTCLACGHRCSRRALARRLHAANPDFHVRASRLAPDGDVRVPDELVERFAVVPCRRCGDGILKPEVVFFGERVPPDRVARCYAWLDDARALLVLGSSLQVMSGYRFVLHARKRGIPVAVVNRGPTRGDGDAAIRIDAGLSGVLPDLAERVTGAPAPAPPPDQPAISPSR